MIQLLAGQITLVKNILTQYLPSHKTYVFGSRATNKAQKFSDLDLCIDGEKISFTQMINLKEAFSESDIPYFVDIVQKATISETFYNHIKSDFIELKIN